VRAFARTPCFSRFAVAGVVLLGLCFALLLAVCPELHDRLHHDGDADGDTHHCLVSLIQSGGCACAGPEAVTVVAQLPGRVEADWAAVSAEVCSVFAGACVFEHGPPFVS
jgi:hypothetical protein